MHVSSTEALTCATSSSRPLLLVASFKGIPVLCFELQVVTFVPLLETLLPLTHASAALPSEYSSCTVTSTSFRVSKMTVASSAQEQSSKLPLCCACCKLQPSGVSAADPGAGNEPVERKYPHNSVRLREFPLLHYGNGHTDNVLCCAHPWIQM